jgi:hypothetical protein
MVIRILFQCGRTARVVVLICATSSIAYAQPRSPLTVFGQGELKSVSPTEGWQTIVVALKVGNARTYPIRVTRSEAFLVSPGGWSSALGDTIAKEKRFLGNSPLVEPGEYSYVQNHTYMAPASHYILALQLKWQNRPAYDYLLQVPLVRQGFETPPPLRVSAPVFIGMQEPIEVLTLSTGEVWLPIVGQVVNISGKPLTLKRWHLAVMDAAGKAVLDRDLTANLRVEQSTESLNEFLFAFTLPSEFRTGKLQIDAEIDLAGTRIVLARPADLERAQARLVKSPVDGRWVWGHGQGESDFHTHYHFPEQRYCYDLYMRGGEGQQTYSGDPNKSESYFAWDKPFRCIEDGKVRAVIDDVPDNFGRKANPANTPIRNSSIVVEHSGGAYSIYNHPRQGSAIVKVGQMVKAGDVLGRVGNAGFSSEPHLHFGFETIDRTGRVRNIPIRIEGLKTVDSKPADGGVPKSGLEYVATTGK